MKLDSISVDIIGSRLVSVAEEMGLVTIRAAYSPNIRERHDCTAALLDEQGDIIAQAEHIPIHLGSILGFIPQIERAYPDGLEPGDVLISNDPHQGGSTHLPDITLVAPIFDDDLRCVGYAAVVAHHAEIGGSLGVSLDIYGEGLNIPIMRLCRGGELDLEVMDMILANCRVPSERKGDLEAQLAAVQLGVKRYVALLDRYGSDYLASGIKQWLAKAEVQARVAVRALTNGTFTFTDYMDSFHVPGQPRPRITATVTISDEKIAVDFAGTSLQVPGQINTTLSALRASVYYALKTVLDSTLPANAGYFRIIDVTAPDGTIVNSSRPAAVLHRSDTCQRVVDAIFGALAGALPDIIPAASNGSITGIVLSGFDPRWQRPFAYVEVVAGGAGALPDRCGQSAVQSHLTNTANTPIEAVEIAYPLEVESYAIRHGSGGAGVLVGGAGIERKIRALSDGIHLSIKGDRAEVGPWGLHGGHTGAPLEFELTDPAGISRPMSIASNGILMERDASITVRSAGGGGYGDVGDGSHKISIEEDPEC